METSEFMMKVDEEKSYFVLEGCQKPCLDQEIFEF